jgi:hypothetical protein
MVGSSLRELARLRDCRSRRFSSWDTTGGNRDFWRIEPGQTRVLADIKDAGCVTHIWSTIGCRERWFLRKLVLRMYWDESDVPSVEVPVGDFFGLGHGEVTYFVSEPLVMFDRGFNCFFPMPFAKGARIEVESQCTEHPTTYYFYIDYEEYDSVPDDLARFHAEWRRVNPCRVPRRVARDETGHPLNPSDRNNYVLLEAWGKGHYVGCNLNIDAQQPGWWGEGDDMIVVDGEPWPPRLHGTGTEDYFCGAWNFNRLHQTFSSPYFGYHFKTNADYTGKHSMYRFHVQDPVTFAKSIRVSIEHGHANDKDFDASSTAYWYQLPIARKRVKLLPVEERLPREWGGLHM